MKPTPEYYLQSYRMLLLDEFCEYEDTIKELNKCLADNPNSNGFNNLGLAQFETGEIEEAFVNFSLAIKIDELNAVAYINRAELNIKWKKINEAESDYDMAVKVDSTNAGNWICRAHFHKENDKHEKALSDFKKAIKIEPNFKSVKKLITEIEGFLGLKPKN